MSAIHDLFTNVAGGTTLKFLKEINLYINKHYFSYIVA
jgi:hypothetical protein